jgi:putative ABC transport system permease protein
MFAPKYLPVVLRQIVRQRTRSVLTILSVAVAMFLFSAVQALQSGARAATEADAGETKLIVYRKDRYCPFASRMTESYAQRINQVPGVASVIPMKIVVSNCRTSLDVVTFRGVPVEEFLAAYGSELNVIGGSFDEWKRRSDAALIGETLAKRRGLSVGDRFDAAGVTVTVAGIISSQEPQHDNVAYVHLDFLQFASGSRRGGWVTQFNVRVDDPAGLQTIADTIDAEFAADQDPTHTRSERAFIAQAAEDVLEIVDFTKWLGWGCVAAVLALVGNAIVVAVQQRVREHAILQTLGYPGHLIARLIVAEGILLSLAGTCLGSALAIGIVRWGGYSLSVDGLSIPIDASWQMVGWGALTAIVLGVLAGLVPAFIASRREVVECFRAV